MVKLLKSLNFSFDTRVTTVTLVFVIVCHFFSGCKSQGEINQVQIQNYQSLIEDSIVLDQINPKKINYFQINHFTKENYVYAKDDTLYMFDKDKLTVRVPQNIFNGHNFILNGMHEIHFEDFEYFLYNLEHDIRYPIKRSVFSIQDTLSHNLHIYHISDIALLNDSILVAASLPNGMRNSTKFELIERYKKRKIFIFAIRDNQLFLKNEIPEVNPSIDLNRSTKFFRIRTALATSKSSFFVTHNFLDTLYEYDFQGNFLRKIGLPEALNFEYYDNSDMSYIPQPTELSFSEILGHKNSFTYTSPNSKKLLILTTYAPNVEIKTAFLLPSVLDCDWYISVYDLEKRTWEKIIKFDKYLDFRNIFLTNDYIFVRDKRKSPTEVKKIKY
jgi:hypothetical protein